MNDDEFKRQRWVGGTGTDTPDPPRPTDEPHIWRAKMPGEIRLLMWLIVAEPDEYRGAILTIEPGIVLGRRGDIRWHDPRMSRQHARFDLVADPHDPSQPVYAIRPLNDRNGTYINGQRITTATPLRENDEIEIGDTLFIVKVLE